MSIDNAIYALSNFNTILGSTMGYVNAVNNGATTGEALSSMGYSIMNGAFRNAMSNDILNRTGSYIGYGINGAAGYGNPVSDYYGTMGTMGAWMMSTPFNIFNPWMTSSLYGCGPYGGGYWNSGFFGGCGCGNNFMFGGPSFFGMRGYWC